MNWKALVLLCLVFFGTAMVVGTALTFRISPPKMSSIAEKAIISESPIEPLGDPVDDKFAPN